MNEINYNGAVYTYKPLREMRESDNALGPISDWFKESKVGEYTFYYTHIVLHTQQGMYAAQHDDLTNGIYV